MLKREKTSSRGFVDHQRKAPAHSGFRFIRSCSAALAPAATAQLESRFDASTSNNSDEIMNEMNDRAKAEGRYLGKTFWEIPPQPGSILVVPSSPEAERRLAALRARRLERRKGPVEHSEPVAPQLPAGADVHEKSNR
jgi:hypothetical protein